ncbi:class I SAM-dependent methyltransferase [Nocardioides pinisoli]|uniref:Class I SAM-dependent methyltransferase n=1 Tax=Nocardioides pinisoli TaxID=2950279 RepID=A0ABT1L3R1_9ACTN|nr:class I SAM-dependent methyltransferase [Nocardioides pinisoli]MCP3423561.1 class I SAM-dependent methyltransferase [Nocardioides pinisoli]
MLLLRRGRSVLSRVGSFSRDRGAADVLRSCAQWGWDWWRGRPGGGRDHGFFEWDGRRLPYFVHHYHYTWLNERAVEVAMALDLLERHAGASVLEVGNVLSHYAPVGHTVVDKYERAPGVLNEDVADLDLGREFDLVLAISTLEHVGLDEDVRDDDKPLRAIERLRAHVAPGGRLWVTHPVGYNAALDARLRDGVPGVARMRALRRDRTRNQWREVPLDEAWGTPYDRLLYTAHAVVVVEINPVGEGAAKTGADEVTGW